MDIYYIRHGEPLYNSPQVALTEVGHKQAEAASRFLSKIDFDYIFSSPLLRAKETAEHTANKLNKEIIIQDWCSEDLASEDVSYRDDNGKILNWIFFIPSLKEDINRLSNNDKWYLDPVFKGHTNYINGKSRVLLEMQKWMKEYLNVDFDGKHFKKLGKVPSNIAIFAHGGFATLFFSTILNINYLDFVSRYKVLDYAGVVHLKVDFDKPNPICEMISYNDVYYDKLK